MGLGIEFKKIWLIFPLFFLMFIILITIVYVNWENVMTKYEEVNSTTKFNGKVIFVKKYKSRCFIRIDNCTEYYLPWADNYNYFPPYLNEFINVGDSIVKTNGNDSLKVIRNQKEFIFVLYSKIPVKN